MVVRQRVSLFSVAAGLVLVAALPLPSMAAITLYTNKASFLTALTPGFYEETDLANNPSQPNYSGSGFAYVMSDVGDFMGATASGDLTTTADTASLNFTFNAGIKAFGAYFYSSNEDGNFAIGDIEIKVNNGSEQVFATPTDAPSPTSSTSFYGFISDTNLSTASIKTLSSTSGNLRYPTVGSVIVGTTGGGPTPAPVPVPLLGAAAAFGASRRLRRRLVAGRPSA